MAGNVAKASSRKVDSAVARARQQGQRREPDAASRRRAALLEVNLGRRGAMAAALAWAVLVMLATLFYWQERVIADPAGFLALFSILLPLGPAVAGLGVSAAALVTKRGSLLGGHLTEDHNLATLGGLVLSAVVLAVALGIQLGSLGQTVGLYTAPAGMMGISLGILGFLLTWSGRSARKIVAALCAVVPSLLSAGHIFSPQNALPIAVWEYMMSGGLFLVAGVIFLVSMTATAPAEREIVRGADARIATEYARLRSLKKELDVAVAQTSARASELEEDAADLEAHRRAADDFAVQAQKLKEEATALYDRAAKAEAAAQGKVAQLEGQAAALAAREADLKALAERRAQDDRSVVELRTAAIQQKGEAETLRRRVEAERQAVAEQLAHAKREREAAKATLQAAEEKARAAQAERQRAQDERSQLESQRAVLTARTSEVDAERLRALEGVQAKLSSERGALEKAREEVEAERARMKREAQALAEREAALASRAADVDSVDKGLGEALAKLASEKAEVEALKRKADQAMAEARASSSNYQESVTKVAEREATARSAGDALKAREAMLAEREKRLKEQDKLLGERAQQLAAERKSMAADRERFSSDALRLKEREEAIFHFEKHPEFAQEAAKALEKELALGKQAAEPAARAAPAAAARPGAGAPQALAAEAAPDRFSVGNGRLNELMGGGLPVGSSLLVVGPAFCGKETIPLGFVAAGLAKGEPAIVVTTVRSPAEVVEELSFMLPAASKARVRTHMRFVDCSGKAARGELPREHVIDVGSPADFAKIRESIGTHFKSFEKEGHASFRFAYMPLTESWRFAEPNVARTFVQQMVAAVRRQAGGAVFVAEAGIHSADEIESLAGMMQGVVRCQEEREGHALKVQGVPGAKPHHWVRYKHSPKGIELGAFELERIR